MCFKTAGKRLFDFYLFGNFHIALCAVALTLTTQALFGLTLRSELLIFIFCGTLFGYNLQRLPATFEARMEKGADLIWRRHSWNLQHRFLLTVLTGLSAMIFIWSFSRLYRQSQTFALIPAALSFAYAIPVIPTRRKWLELREIPGLKIFVIAVAWACSCALLPIASVHRPGGPWFSTASLAWAFVCGALIFALTIPFDIRDLRYDAVKLRTLPAVLGVSRSIRLAMIALIGSVAISWAICGYSATGTAAQAFAYSIWCAIAGLFILKSTPERSEYYFSFWIDGLVIVLWLMIYIATV